MYTSVSSPRDSITLCTVAGELDYRTADIMRQALVGSLPTAAATVVIDLSMVTFFGVAGLRVLMEARSWIGHTGRRLQLITGPRCVDRLLEVAGHDAVFDMAPSLADVVANEPRVAVRVTA